MVFIQTVSKFPQKIEYKKEALMLLLLFFIFILVPTIELSVLIKVGHVLGTFNTIALCLFTAVVGASLVRSQGISTLLQAQKKMAQGALPQAEIVQGMMLAMAGVLLVIPGFVTDFIGLLLLTPITRKPLAQYFLKRMQVKMTARGQFSQQQNPFNQSPFSKDNSFEGNTFDGEYEKKQEPEKQIKDKDTFKD